MAEHGPLHGHHIWSLARRPSKYVNIALQGELHVFQLPVAFTFSQLWEQKLFNISSQRATALFVSCLI